MVKILPVLFAAILALMVGIPTGSELTVVAVAMFRLSARSEDLDRAVDGFSLLNNASTSYLLTDALGVVRIANTAAHALADDLSVSCAAGTHMRAFVISDPEVESKIYQVCRGAFDGTSKQMTFQTESQKMHVDVCNVGDENALLWAVSLEKIEAEAYKAQEIDARLDDAPIGFFSADRGGAIVAMNSRLASWLDIEWPLPDSETLALSDILCDGARRLSPALAKVGVTVTEMASLRVKDGDPKPVQIVQSLSDAEDGGTVTRSFIFPKSAERETEVRATAGARLVRFLDDAPVSVALTTKDGVIVEANDMLVEMSGGAARVGAEVSVAVRPEDRTDVMNRIAYVVSGNTPEIPLEVRLLGDDNVEHEARFHVHTVSTERGEMLLNYLIDVTEMKKIEHQLAQMQKMQAVGQLAGGIAHDVNNVLTAIRGHCDLLMLRHHDGDPDFEYLNQIRLQTERAAEVISHLLAYSRQQTMKRQVTQLTDMLDDMQFMLKHLTTERVSFSVQHARDLGLVRIDQSEFQRVVMNLAVNASHAMPDGGNITMRTSNIAADHPIIGEYEILTRDPYVLVEVTDTGTGIAPKHLGKIFEPFFTTKEQGQGTGLGLSTVYGIIKQMHGFIFCESEVGEGTTFRIFLPRFDGAISVDETLTVAKPPANDKPRDLSGSGCVLLVEDEDAVRSFAVRALEIRGYTVLAAAGGEEALEIFLEDPDAIDLIVSDVIMPGMTGPEMMRKVREVREDVLFIFISGYAEDAFREEMLDDDNFRFLPKPFSLNDLATKVKETLVS